MADWFFDWMYSSNFVDWVLVICVLIAVLAIASGVYLIVGLRTEDKKNARLWDRCIEKSSEYKVYCLGQEVDKSKVNFKALDKRNWNYRINDVTKEIHLNPITNDPQGDVSVILPFIINI